MELPANSTVLVKPMIESKKLTEARAIVAKGYARLAVSLATADLTNDVIKEFLSADDATVLMLTEKYVPLEVLKVVDRTVETLREYPETLLEPVETQFLRQLVAMALRSAQATVSQSQQALPVEGDAR